MRRLIMSRLICIYTVCKGISFEYRPERDNTLKGHLNAGNEYLKYLNYKNTTHMHSCPYKLDICCHHRVNFISKDTKEMLPCRSTAFPRHQKKERWQTNNKKNHIWNHRAQRSRTGRWNRFWMVSRKQLIRRLRVRPPGVGNILSWRLIMKCFLRSFSPFRWFKKDSCQFLAKECAQYWLTTKRTRPAR